MKHRYLIMAGLMCLAITLGCAQAATPMPLVGAGSLPTSASVTVAPTPTLPTEPPPADAGSGMGGTPVTTVEGDNTLAGFRQALLDNLISRNYDYLQYAMADPFTIGLWQSEGTDMPPSQAVEELRTIYLPPENVVSYDFDKDLAALFGVPKDQIFPPDAGVVDAVWMDGWGTDGQGEAIIFISQTADGTFAWFAMIFAGTGF